MIQQFGQSSSESEDDDDTVEVLPNKVVSLTIESEKKAVISQQHFKPSTPELQKGNFSSKAKSTKGKYEEVVHALSIAISSKKGAESWMEGKISITEKIV